MMDINTKCLYTMLMLIAQVGPSSATPAQTGAQDLMPRSSPSQVNCSFDIGMCSWKQDKTDRFDWVRLNGPTSSGRTGPVADHSGTGYYVYIETSAPHHQGDKARLISPQVSPNQQGQCCFTFWYHMYGSNIGRLNVYIQSGSSLSSSPIWYKHGNQSNQWFEANIPISAAKPFNIILEGIRDNGHRVDIAIDDIALTGGSCGSQFADYSLKGAIDVVCSKYRWQISVDMNKLRHIYPTAKASDIYLGENKCTGVETGNLLIFHQDLSECLTSELLNNGSKVYNNELIYAEHDPVYLFIVLHYNWTVGVECHVGQNGTAIGGFPSNETGAFPNNETEAMSLNASSRQYPVNVSFYHDQDFVNEIGKGNPLHAEIGEHVYVKVFTTATDWNIRMRVHTCYTKPTELAYDHLQYFLIKDRCEVNTNTHIISQSTHETRFVFDNFEYSNGTHDGIYMFCDALFCDSSDWSAQCRQTCSPV